jgi:hypothetical protein
MKRGLITLLIIILFSGCLPRQAEYTVSDADKISTFVAATQTAAPIAEDHSPQISDTPSADQGDTPGSEPTATPSATSTATPTPTLTATPTMTLTPTLSAGDPVLTLGVPSFQDDFENGSNIYTYDDSQTSFQAENRKLVLVAKKANNYEAWTLAWGELRNFYLEIRGEFGPDCGGKDRYGMIFRAPDTSEGYLLSVSCEGSYRLSKYESDDDEYSIIKNWTSSQHINSGPGGVNRLGIRVKNSKLTGFINGKQVFELTDSTFDKGRWGVLVAATNTPGFTAYLTQAAYWKLP